MKCTVKISQVVTYAIELEAESMAAAVAAVRESLEHVPEIVRSLLDQPPAVPDVDELGGGLVEVDSSDFRIEPIQTDPDGETFFADGVALSA
jgi:hypothetical protein